MWQSGESLERSGKGFIRPFQFNFLLQVDRERLNFLHFALENENVFLEIL